MIVVYRHIVLAVYIRKNGQLTTDKKTKFLLIMITDICTPPLILPTRGRLLLSKIQIVHASSLTKPSLFLNDSFLFTNVPSFPANTVIACLLWSINCDVE